jgi:hypothetical protein
MRDESGRHQPATAPGARALATRRVRYHASRLQTSPQFGAVLDVLFDLPRRTEPGFAELVLADGRLLFARTAGEQEFGHYCGRREELVDNLAGWCRHLGFGADECAYVFARVDGIPRADSAL